MHNSELTGGGLCLRVMLKNPIGSGVVVYNTDSKNLSAYTTICR